MDSGRQLLISDCTAEHYFNMCDRIRQADRDEIWATSHLDADTALAASIIHSNFLCWAVEWDDEVVSVFGCSPDPTKENTGNPWLLGTDELATFGFGIVRNSRYYVEQMLKEYQYLENYVDVRNEVSIRWLKWCGFHFDSPQPYGLDQLLFSRFWQERE